MTKGLIACYLNRDEFGEQDEEKLLQSMTVANDELVKLAVESGYAVIFIPTVDEGSRVEKIDFDKPFPLYRSKPTAEDEDRQKKKKDKKEKAND